MSGMSKEEAIDITEKFTRVAVAVETFTKVQEGMNIKLDNVILATQKNTTFRERYENWSRIKIGSIITAASSLIIGIILIIIKVMIIGL